MMNCYKIGKIADIYSTYLQLIIVQMRFAVPCAHFSINLFDRSAGNGNDTAVSGEMHPRKMIFINFSVICLTACVSGLVSIYVSHWPRDIVRRIMQEPIASIEIWFLQLHLSAQRAKICNEITFTRWHIATNENNIMNTQHELEINFIFAFHFCIEYCMRPLFAASARTILPSKQH